MLTTMLSTMAHALSEVMVRYDGRPDPPAADPGLHGLGACYRLYEAADDWVFLAAVSEREWNALARVVGLDDDPRFSTAAARAEHANALADALAAVFATRPAADWERDLCVAGVACVVAERTPIEGVMMDDDGLGRAGGYVTDVVHPVVGEHARLEPLVAFSRSGKVIEPGCTVGQHTDAVLRELGYDDDRIADLRARGVVGGGGSAA
jgi:crotonobetainyl-CoA:carnitine CoA-transferase CaiB-like acyl-CoA transferase